MTETRGAPYFRWLLSIVLVGLVAALAFYVRNTFFELVEEEETHGFRAAAAANPFLALGRFVEAMGLETTSARSLARLPETDRVLWLVAPRRQSAPERLMKWIAAGGHAVIVPVDDGEDLVLDALGVVRFDEEEADEDDADSMAVFETERPDWPKLYAPDGPSPARAEGPTDAAWILTLPHGDGFATVVSDGEFLTNGKLDSLDHALAAWWITDWRQPAGAHFVLRDPPPSMWGVLSSRARPFAVSLGVLVLAGLLVAGRRFGPLAPSPSRDRRHLADHLRASGDFLWHLGCEDVLLRAEREALRRRLSRGRPLADDDFTEAALAAAAGAGVDPEAVRFALENNMIRDRGTFKMTVHALETLRRSL
ncbi:MAG: DUF4350 domain-containing protein [Acidobacteriota bacterium]